MSCQVMDSDCYQLVTKRNHLEGAMPDFKKRSGPKIILLELSNIIKEKRRTANFLGHCSKEVAQKISFNLNYLQLFWPLLFLSDQSFSFNYIRQFQTEMVPVALGHFSQKYFFKKKWPWNFLCKKRLNSPIYIGIFSGQQS